VELIGRGVPNFPAKFGPHISIGQVFHGYTSHLRFSQDLTLQDVMVFGWYLRFLEDPSFRPG
jgi:hypothetical protein